jgi:hypothetical protein
MQVITLALFSFNIASLERIAPSQLAVKSAGVTAQRPPACGNPPIRRDYGNVATLCEVPHTKNPILCYSHRQTTALTLPHPTGPVRTKALGIESWGRASPLLAEVFELINFCALVREGSGSASAGPFSLWAHASPARLTNDGDDGGRRHAVARPSLTGVSDGSQRAQGLSTPAVAYALASARSFPGRALTAPSTAARSLWSG